MSLSYCKLAIYGRVPEVLGVIQPVPNEELVRRIEADEPHGIPQVLGDVLVEERADSERSRTSSPKRSMSRLQGATGVDDVLDQENVLTLERRFRIVDQSYVPLDIVASP